MSVGFFFNICKPFLIGDGDLDIADKNLFHLNHTVTCKNLISIVTSELMYKDKYLCHMTGTLWSQPIDQYGEGETRFPW